MVKKLIFEMKTCYRFLLTWLIDRLIDWMIYRSIIAWTFWLIDWLIVWLIEKCQFRVKRCYVVPARQRSQAKEKRPISRYQWEYKPGKILKSSKRPTRSYHHHEWVGSAGTPHKLPVKHPLPHAFHERKRQTSPLGPICRASQRCGSNF